MTPDTSTPARAGCRAHNGTTSATSASVPASSRPHVAGIASAAKIPMIDYTCHTAQLLAEPPR